MARGRTITGSGAPPALDGDRRPNLLRVLSEQDVLEVIFREGPVTRPQIAERTRLSKATVGAAVERLQKGGMIRSSGPLHGRRGRSPVAYEVRDRVGFVIGVDIAPESIRVSAADIFGEPVAQDAQSLAGEGSRGVTAQVVELTSRLAERARSTHEQLLAIAISTPGVIDQASHRVTSLAHNVSPDGGLDPLSAIRSRFDVPVLIENDVNLAAFAESWHGLARGLSTFAVVWIGAGVGMGLMINGEVVRGAHGAAGEIGFLPGDDELFDRRHRLHGGLEDRVGAAGWVAAFTARTGGRDGAGGASQPGSAQDVLAMAADGHAAARDVVDEVARRVGAAIASVIAVVDPELIVLSGEIGSRPQLLAPVRATVARLVPLTARIETSRLGQGAALEGAVALALRDARAQLFRRPDR